MNNINIKNVIVKTDASMKNDLILVGIYIETNKITLSSRRIFKNHTNDCKNNVCMAELIGINSGLEFILKEKHCKLFMNKNIIVCNDNKLSIEKINKNKTKMCKKNIKKIESKLKSSVFFKWISRKNNKNADSLCRKYYMIKL